MEEVLWANLLIQNEQILREKILACAASNAVLLKQKYFKANVLPLSYQALAYIYYITFIFEIRYNLVLQYNLNELVVNRF